VKNVLIGGTLFCTSNSLKPENINRGHMYEISRLSETI
jgi:hypothetical protein